MKKPSKLITEVEQAVLKNAETMSRGQELLTRAQAVSHEIEQRVKQLLDGSPEKSAHFPARRQRGKERR
jgi:hypothetical protein